MPKRRITPDAARAIGTATAKLSPRTPQYNIVGGSSMPVGPDPLKELADSLSGFNTNLQYFAGAMSAAGSDKAKEMLPDLMRQAEGTDGAEGLINDKTNEIHKAFTKNKWNPFYNSAVQSAAVSLVGNRYGKNDVLNILNSSDFALFEKEQRSKDGDYVQELRNEIYKRLPNRNADDKTTSSQWKRGYDPAVRDEMDAYVKNRLAVRQHQQLQEIRNEHMLKAQDTLSRVVKTGDVTEFSDLMTYLYKRFPADMANGIGFNKHMLQNVVKPIFEQALLDPDSDLDELGATFDKVIGIRRKTEKGSTLMFGADAEGVELWWSKLLDAEAAKGSVAARRQAADNTVLENQMNDFAAAAPDFFKQNPELAFAGITRLRDVNVDNFKVVVDAIAFSKYIPFDEKLWERQARGNKASLIRKVLDKYEAAYNARFKNNTDATENENTIKMNLIQENPQFQTFLRSLDFKSALKSEDSYTSALKKQMADKLDQRLIANDIGVEHNVIGTLLNNTLTKIGTDAAVGSLGELVAYYERLYENRLINDSTASEITRVVQKEFKGDDGHDEKLKAIIAKINADGQSGLNQISESFSFDDTLQAASASSSANATQGKPSLFRDQIVSYYNQYVSTIRRGAEPFEEGKAIANSGAAQTIILQIEDDYHRFLAHELRAWMSTVDRSKGTPVSQMNDKTRNEIKNRVAGKIINKQIEYESTYRALTADPKDEAERDSMRAVGQSHFPEKANHLEMLRKTQLREANLILDNVLGKDPRGHSKLVKGEPVVKGGSTFPVELYSDMVDYSGDSRYGKLMAIPEKAKEFRSLLQERLKGKLRDRNKASKDMLLNPDEPKAEADDNEIEQLVNEYRKHHLRYFGISDWKGLMEGKTDIGFSVDGLHFDIPIKPSDVNFDDNMAFDSWDEMNRLEGLFDRKEAIEELNERKQKGEKVPPVDVLTPDEEKELELYKKYVKLASKADIDFKGNPVLRQNQQQLYRNWSARQRLQLISTDPSRMPEKMRKNIKRKAVENFLNSADNNKEYRWRGKTYTQNDADRVRAVRDYNDFIASNDFSLKEGVTTEEFLTLYSGAVGGNMYQHRYHLRGGAFRGSSGSSTATTTIDPKKELTEQQKKVIAQELASAALGFENVTGGTPLYKGKRVHPYNLMKEQYLGQYNKMYKLLDSAKGSRSPELAKAFQVLHGAAEPAYTAQPEKIDPLRWFPSEWLSVGKDFTNWLGLTDGRPLNGLLTRPRRGAAREIQESGSTDLLSPFDMELLPIPNN